MSTSRNDSPGGKSSPTQSPRRSKNTHNIKELPLLDEINELIDKERTVLNLKLLAQKVETDEWRAKYDSLAEKVETGIGGDFTTTEDVAAIDDGDAHGAEQGTSSNASQQDLLRIISERLHPWILDLSHLRIDRVLLARICKAVFGAKASFPGIHVAVLRGCSLDDEFADVVSQLVRCSPLLALDLSANELGEATFLQIVSVLKERRTTPQYLLLDRNVPLSRSAKLFPSIIEALTEHTWGLTASLEDFNNAIAALNSKLPSQRRISQKNELNQDYKEVIKHPMRIFEFLRAVNAKLDPLHHTSSTSTSIAQHKGVRTPRVRSMVPGRENALNHLSVLGLTCSQFSKRSITELASTLRLTAPSLTDLDLSFAYLGFAGAEVLKSALSSGDCQIVRLAAPGNAFGDLGVKLLCSSLAVNRTLVYLDLRSNSVSSTGLRWLQPLLLNSAVLSVVDLRGNNQCSQAAASELKSFLWQKGSRLKLRMTYLDDQPLEMKSNENISEPLHEISEQISSYGELGKPVRLYSIDLTAININYPEACGQPLLLQWLWRPAPLGTPAVGVVFREHAVNKDTTATSSAATTAVVNSSMSYATESAVGRLPRGAGSNEASFLARGSRYAVKWEVRITFNHSELRTFTGQLAETTSTTRRLLQLTPDWAVCSCLLSELPLKGNIEVWGSMSATATADGDQSQHRSITAATTARRTEQQQQHAVKKSVQSAFESMRLQLSRVQTAKPDEFFVAGDTAAFGASYANSLVNCDLFSSAKLKEVDGMLSSFEVMRAMRCPTNTTTSAAASNSSTLRWQAKLVGFPDRDGASAAAAENKSSLADAAVAGSSDASSSAEEVENAPPNHATLGYCWRLLAFSSNGSCRLLHEGDCGGMEHAVPTAATTTAGGSSSSSSGGVDKPLTGDAGVLKAWVWRTYEVPLAAIHQQQQQGDDLIVLAAKVVSTQANYPPKYLQQCSAIVSNFHFTQRVSAAADAKNESDVAAAIRKSLVQSYEIIHDDPNCDISL